MAQHDRITDPDTESEALDAPPESELSAAEDDAVSAVESPGDFSSPAQLGVAKYVQGAFFAAGIAVAYVVGKLLEALWNGLAALPSVAQSAHWLLLQREDERPTYTMTIGAIVGVVATLQAYRRPVVREWADEVASELSKVHWPEKEVVQNGTVVVIVASLFATLYVGLLDRFWIFVTTLVYGT